MKGCRPLSAREISAILGAIDSNRFALRDRAFFLVGHRTGFRVSELLSLRLGDVVQNGNFTDRISVARAHMKKKTEGRTVLLHNEAREALQRWVELLTKMSGEDPGLFLFKSGWSGNRPVHRRTAWAMLKRAYKKCGLTGKLGCHSLRKTFAKRMYENLNRDLVKTQKALNHKSINSTVSYLSFADEDIDEAILKS